MANENNNQQYMLILAAALVGGGGGNLITGQIAGTDPDPFTGSEGIALERRLLARIERNENSNDMILEKLNEIRILIATLHGKYNIYPEVTNE